MRILVCGGGGFGDNDREHVFEALDKLHRSYGVDEVLRGAGKIGLDCLVRDWRTSRSIPRERVFFIRWRNRLPDHGFRDAKYSRDLEMFEALPDLVVLFETGLAASLMKLADAAEIPIVVVEPSGHQRIIGRGWGKFARNVIASRKEKTA